MAASPLKAGEWIWVTDHWGAKFAYVLKVDGDVLTRTPYAHSPEDFNRVNRRVETERVVRWATYTRCAPDWGTRAIVPELLP